MKDFSVKKESRRLPFPSLVGDQGQQRMHSKAWLKVAAGMSFFMAACQTIISISPAAASYFGAPPSLLENRRMLFIIGESAALVLVIFSLYALSGIGKIRRLPLLRIVLIAISTLFLLRGSFIVFTVLRLLGIIEGKILIQGVISHLIFLSAGIAFAGGTILNWREMKIQK